MSEWDVDTAAKLLADSLDKPSVARVYDYLLGGNSNYEVDRNWADAQVARFPDLKKAAIINRRLLHRVVRHACEQGIRQFLDLGAGLPTAGCVHEVAELAVPGEAHVVYVDNEPIAHAHATLLLADSADTARHHALDIDVLEHAALWRRVVDNDWIDPEQPVCVLALALLHFMADERQPQQSIRFFQQQAAPQSMLAISHVYNGTDDPELANTISAYSSTTSGMVDRSRADIERFFGGWSLVSPGLVWSPQWRPDEPVAEDPTLARALAGVAVKPRE